MGLMVIALTKTQKASLRDLKALDAHWAGTRFLLQNNIHNSEEKTTV